MSPEPPLGARMNPADGQGGREVRTRSHVYSPSQHRTREDRRHAAGEYWSTPQLWPPPARSRHAGDDRRTGPASSPIARRRRSRHRTKPRRGAAASRLRRRRPENAAGDALRAPLRPNLKRCGPDGELPPVSFLFRSGKPALECRDRYAASCGRVIDRFLREPRRPSTDVNREAPSADNKGPGRREDEDEGEDHSISAVWIGAVWRCSRAHRVRLRQERGRVMWQNKQLRVTERIQPLRLTFEKKIARAIRFRCQFRRTPSGAP
jgi:hypothetical protein